MNKLKINKAQSPGKSSRAPSGSPFHCHWTQSAVRLLINRAPPHFPRNRWAYTTRIDDKLHQKTVRSKQKKICYKTWNHQESISLTCFLLSPRTFTTFDDFRTSGVWKWQSNFSITTMSITSIIIHWKVFHACHIIVKHFNKIIHKVID